MPHVERLGRRLRAAPGRRPQPAVAETARALRADVLAALPDAVEQVDFGNKLLAVGKSTAMRDLAFAIIPHSAHVNLQLADGVDLPNPDGRIEGTGKRIRHVKVRGRRRRRLDRAARGAVVGGAVYRTHAGAGSR